MDISDEKRPSHKEWRRQAKRERRRRLRRKAAQERDADAEHLDKKLQNTTEYSTWVEEQEEKEKQQQSIQEQEHVERERKWLKDELRAQEEWKALQERREKARQAQLEQEEMIRKEYEEKQEVLRRKHEEEKRQIEEQLKKQEEMQKEIDDYIDNGAKTPEVLRAVTETQPGKEICQFYAKTGACRYGDMCSRNHQKLSLSKVILMPGFYTHFSLEKNSNEYDTDVSLEYENSERRQHFEEFYKDVVPELESFGEIKTLKYCYNTEVHLRGNLYVEYYSERDAARALRKLKGRWFARRQINCEFTCIKSWRTAICGMSKCPKGRACNFLHVFKNPKNEYDVKSPPRWAKRQDGQESSKREGSRRSDNKHKFNWDDSERSNVDNSRRSWRWNSPDSDPDNRMNESTRRRYPEDRHSSKRSVYVSSSRSRNHDESRTNRDFDDSSDEEHHFRHRDSRVRSRKYGDEYKNGDDSRHRRSSYHGRYSNRSGYHSYHSRSDRDRHRKRSHERVSRHNFHNREKGSKALQTSDRENSKSPKRKGAGKVKSKWDEDNYSPKAKSNSSSSSSSSSARSTSSSSDSSSNEEETEPNVKLPSTEPEPKRQKVTVSEFYEWDTTESEDEDTRKNNRV